MATHAENRHPYTNITAQSGGTISVDTLNINRVTTEEDFLRHIPKFVEIAFAQFTLATKRIALTPYIKTGFFAATSLFVDGEIITRYSTNADLPATGDGYTIDTSGQFIILSNDLANSLVSTNYIYMTYTHI